VPDNTVGDILRAERQRRRLSQAQAGVLVGYSSSTLSRIERGDRRLHIDGLRRFADRYGIAPERLGLATLSHQPVIDESGEHVQRRQFLVAAAGLTVPHGVLRRLDDTLVTLPATPGPVTAATGTPQGWQPARPCSTEPSTPR
jgi:transcriptional regulator with XRE-family HTH domain